LKALFSITTECFTLTKSNNYNILAFLEVLLIKHNKPFQNTVLGGGGQGCRKLTRARGAICYQKGIFFKKGQKQK
jgi:hypothetical protein